MGAPTKRKREGDTGRVKTQRRLETIMNEAEQLDRRRQAQIRNQRDSITRLLTRFEADPEAGARVVYSKEMAILHEGSAALAADLDSLRDVVRRLVSAMDTAPAAGRDTVMTIELADALSVARSWLTGGEE